MVKIIYMRQMKWKKIKGVKRMMIRKYLIIETFNNNSQLNDFWLTIARYCSNIWCLVLFKLFSRLLIRLLIYCIFSSFCLFSIFSSFLVNSCICSTRLSILSSLYFLNFWKNLCLSVLYVVPGMRLAIYPKLNPSLTLFIII